MGTQIPTADPDVGEAGPGSPMASSDRRIKVMFFITSLEIGGQECRLLDIVRFLDADRFQPMVCCLKDPGPLAAEFLRARVPLRSNLLASKLDVLVLARLVRILKKERVSVAYTVGRGDKMFWGRLAAKLAGVPAIVSSIHKAWVDDPARESAIGTFNRMLTPLTDCFIAVSESARRFLITHERLPPEKIRVIYDGIEIERFGPAGPSDEARRAFGVPLTQPVVGIVGALRPEKNHLLFIETAREVLVRRPECLFLIVGDGPMRALLEQTTRDLGIEPHVRFLGFRRDIPEILSTFDVSVLTSNHETFPNILLESMAAGKPVVTTDCEAVREIVSEGDEGLIVPVGDGGAMAEAILRILDDRTLAVRMGESGRASVRKRFPVQRMVRDREKLFEELLASKERTHRGSLR